jgi:DNA-binding NarL/FixJ family response regulator
MSNIINIAIVDDEQLFVDGLCLLLEPESTLNVQFTASDGQALLDTLATSEQIPELILLDLKMQPLDGIETTKILRDEYPEVKIIVLSTFYREAFIGQMVKLGVNAFLPKNTDAAELKFAIRMVVEKGLYFTQDLTEVLRGQIMGKRLTSPSFQHDIALTAREKEVLALICRQYTAPEIAEQLHVSHRTVDGHRNNLLLKIGARNIVGLVVYGLLHGYLDADEHLLDYTLNH